MESMTGYAFVEKSTSQFSYSVEIKTLNNKYQDIVINLPKIVRNEENDIHKLIKEKIKRGKVVVTLELFDWKEERPVSINSELLMKYYNELSKIHYSLNLKESLNLDSLLTLDGITQRERTVISPKSIKDIYSSLDLALKSTLEMRKKEGKSVKIDIQTALTNITVNVNEIKKLTKNVSKTKNEELKKRIETISDKKIDDVRLYTEIAILADKLDINEEVVRLNDHIKKFKTLLKATEPAGKMVDFLAQEMFREINTISSKASSSEISHFAVDVKNQIDRIREQGRNIV